MDFSLEKDPVVRIVIITQAAPHSLANRANTIAIEACPIDRCAWLWTKQPRRVSISLRKSAIVGALFFRLWVLYFFAKNEKFNLWGVRTN